MVNATSLVYALFGYLGYVFENEIEKSFDCFHQRSQYLCNLFAHYVVRRRVPVASHGISQLVFDDFFSDQADMSRSFKLDLLFQNYVSYS